MSFAEKGAVGDIDPAFFVGYLHRVKATGTLKFEDAPIQRAIYFRDGRVLFSSSNAHEDQLGAILVAGGKITQEQFDGLLASLEPKQSIAAALAQGGYVAQRDIGDAARKKVEQIVGSCCAQTTGRYEFEDGVLPKGALDLKLTTERVLINAFEALEPSGFLIRILKSPMAVLAAADVQPTEPELVRLKEALDGMSSLADIGGAVGMSLPATEVRAAALVVMGAASVVTSQIEEMALPDTGETTPGLMLDDAEPVEADTLAFALSPTGGDVSFEAESPGQSALGSADATLVMGAGLDVSSDATLATGALTSSGLDLSPHTPSDRGAQSKREKASTQDLAAVKELLGSAGVPQRPASASIPSKTWEPVLSSAGRPGSREKRGLAGFVGNPVVQKSAAALLIVGLAGVGWLVYSASQASAPTPTPSPAPAAPATTATGAPASAALTTPPAAATGPAPSPSGTVAAAVPAPSVATPPKVAAATPPAPVPTATPKPPVIQTPAPTPAVAAVAQPSPRAPSAVAAPAGASLAAAYQALKAGQLTEAATAAESVARSRSGEFSLQILVACSPQTIEKALVNDASTELFVLPATIAGKACFRLMRGLFMTTEEASRAMATLPPYYVAEGAKPRAVPVKAVLR